MEEITIPQDVVSTFGRYEHNGEAHWYICECGKPSPPVPHSWQASDAGYHYCCGADKAANHGPASAEKTPSDPTAAVLAVIIRLLTLGCNGALWTILKLRKQLRSKA